MVRGKKVHIVTQARIGSSRFPEKILKLIDDKTLIEHHINRLLNVKDVDKVILATTNETGIDDLIDVLKEKNIKIHQGSTDNVLSRFYNSLKNNKPDYVVRVTSDCPLIDHHLIYQVIDFTIENNLDYGANILKDDFPDGQDIEVFKFEALESAYKLAKLNSDKEHVTTYIRRNSSYCGGEVFKSDNFPNNTDFSKIRMTVDEPEDLEAIKTLVEKVGVSNTWQEYTDYIVNNLSSFSNQSIIRNEGLKKSLKND
jgi:spore coat polysaccharide biosynthesis protein SpsF (cytidylyltransferase family)